MTKPYRSKAIRHMRSGAKGIFRSTGKVAIKGIEKTARWSATDHSGSAQHINLMQIEQRIHYSIAHSKLLNRRMTRRLNSGGQASVNEVIRGWIADYMHYFLDLLWGFIGPLLSYILLTIFGMFLVLLFSLILFYVLFRLLFS